MIVRSFGGRWTSSSTPCHGGWGQGPDGVRLALCTPTQRSALANSKRNSEINSSHFPFFSHPSRMLNNTPTHIYTCIYIYTHTQMSYTTHTEWASRMTYGPRGILFQAFPIIFDLFCFPVAGPFYHLRPMPEPLWSNAERLPSLERLHPKVIWFYFPGTITL